MKLIIFVCSILFLVNSAAAESDWVYIKNENLVGFSREHTAEVFYDKRLISDQTRFIQLWMMFSLKNRLIDGWSSLKERVEIDCRESSFRKVEIIGYTFFNATGYSDFVKNTDPGWHLFKDKADSAYAMMAAKMCQK
jgi:hypothetical protein